MKRETVVVEVQLAIGYDTPEEREQAIRSFDPLDMAVLGNYTMRVVKVLGEVKRKPSKAASQARG